MRFSGMPLVPNPPTRMVAPSNNFAIAASALATRLSIDSCSWQHQIFPLHTKKDKAPSFRAERGIPLELIAPTRGIPRSARNDSSEHFYSAPSNRAACSLQVAKNFVQFSRSGEFLF